MLDQLFKKLERFEPIPAAEKAFLQNAPWRVVEFGPDEQIVIEGDYPSESCLVLEGMAYRFKTLPQGSRQILAFHIPGDFGDLHSFLLKRMEHGMASCSRCRIARLPHSTIRTISDMMPNLARSLWWDTALDASIHREWMVSMGRRTTDAQVAHLFCELLWRFRLIDMTRDNSFDLPFTQAQLADAFGLSPVHVNRSLQRLKREGLVVQNGKRVALPKLDQLMEVAEFDPDYLELPGQRLG